MDETRRTGIDLRNKKDSSPSGNKSNLKEQRKLLKNNDDIIKLFKKIPMFEGLTTEQLSKMLNICSKKKYNKYEYLCRIDDDPENMFIILKGKVSILFKLGFELQNITPAGTVGEMGIFTGKKRSASIKTVTDCIVLKFSKVELFKIFKNDIDLYNKILLNVINDLSQKIRKNNEQLDESLFKIRASYDL